MSNVWKGETIALYSIERDEDGNEVAKWMRTSDLPEGWEPPGLLVVMGRGGIITIGGNLPDEVAEDEQGR